MQVFIFPFLALFLPIKNQTENKSMWIILIWFWEFWRRCRLIFGLFSALEWPCSCWVGAIGLVSIHLLSAQYFMISTWNRFHMKIYRVKELLHFSFFFFGCTIKFKINFQTCISCYDYIYLKDLYAFEALNNLSLTKFIHIL